MSGCLNLKHTCTHFVAVFSLPARMRHFKWTDVLGGRIEPSV